MSQFLPPFGGLVSLKLLKIERNLPLAELPEFGTHPALDAKARAKINAFAATTTKNGGWVRG